MDSQRRRESRLYAPGVIFDGDDTLWETAPLYARAKQEFFNKMSSLGYDRRDVERDFHNIDVANVDRLGFSKHRFATSMVETYRLFCNRSSLPYERSIERKIEAIAYGIFGNTLTTYECAEHVLARLWSHYKLILATKGDEEIQLAKIDQSGLAHFFSSIQILDHKTEREFRRIAEECKLDISSSWVVGDSLRSDINPALEVGFRAIWIPNDAWAYENADVPDSDRLFKVNALQDSLRLLIPEEV